MTVHCNVSHMVNFHENIGDVVRLLDIHRQVAGSAQGRRVGMECLNKSAIVLILASWEAFIEDLAENAFKCMLENADSHTVFSKQVLDLSWSSFKSEKTQDAMQQLETGWKTILVKHQRKTIAKFIERGNFNTPSGPNIDTLFAELVGLNAMTKNWSWKKQTHAKSVNKLSLLIDLRGAIAHRAAAEDSVKKTHVLEYAQLVVRLAAKSHNAVAKHLAESLGFDACLQYSQASMDKLIDQLNLVETVPLDGNMSVIDPWDIPSKV
jgi:hypothetical protein